MALPSSFWRPNFCPSFANTAAFPETPLAGSSSRVVREECHRNFWCFTKKLLDGGSTCQTSPEFSASTAHSFFSNVYQSAPHQFQTPSWMPSASPPAPDCSMEMSPVSEEELTRVIKKSRSSSAPSPSDRISYIINAPLFGLLYWISSTGSSWREMSLLRGR